MIIFRFGLLCLICAATLAVFAQSGPVPMVTFGLDFPGSQPEHYAVEVPASGNATYSSNSKVTENSEADKFQIDFTLSDATRTRIFELAKRARYFDGVTDAGKKNLAFTGSKLLTYHDAQRDTKLRYNYCQNNAVQELTALFQNLSTTLEFGRRLDYYHRYQKLALDAELKRMEAMIGQNSLDEVTALTPILDGIAKDQTVINPVRARAQRIMERANTTGKP